MSWDWGTRGPLSPGPRQGLLAVTRVSWLVWSVHGQWCVWAGMGTGGRGVLGGVPQSLGCSQPVPVLLGSQEQAGPAEHSGQLGLCSSAHSCPARGRRNLVLPSLEYLLVLHKACPALSLVSEHKMLLQGQGLGLSPCPHGC